MVILGLFTMDRSFTPMNSRVLERLFVVYYISPSARMPEVGRYTYRDLRSLAATHPSAVFGWLLSLALSTSSGAASKTHQELPSLCSRSAQVAFGFNPGGVDLQSRAESPMPGLRELSVAQ